MFETCEGRTQTVFDPRICRRITSIGRHPSAPSASWRSPAKSASARRDTRNPRIATRGEIDDRRCQPRVPTGRGVRFAVDDPEVARGERGIALQYLLTWICAGRRWRETFDSAEKSRTLPRRVFMDEQGFLEVKRRSCSSPRRRREGIPRPQPRELQVLRLPQSPNSSTQILMVGGVERLYQAFPPASGRDQRPIEQLEFTQIDIEMSFIEREEFYAR